MAKGWKNGNGKKRFNKVRNGYLKNRWGNGGRYRVRRGPQRSMASNVLTQGVGATPMRPWGGLDNYTLAAWDAKLPQHLPLPRGLGPYTTIRCTKRLATAKRCLMVGTFQMGNFQPDNYGCWSELCALQPVDPGAAINHPNNTGAWSMDLSGLGDAATITPSALTVQLMCPTELENAKGILYVGCMNTQPKIAGRTQTWLEYFDQFVNFQSPRLLSAGKIVLRGVQLNSYPLNMTEVSKFTTIHKDAADNAFTYIVGEPETTGWAPIMIYNPNEAELEVLITIEYRVRFDLNHPASSSHVHHKAASDWTWDRLAKQASAMGHGCMDIADVVANTGQAVQRAVRIANAVGGGARGALAIGM